MSVRTAPTPTSEVEDYSTILANAERLGGASITLLKERGFLPVGKGVLFRVYSDATSGRVAGSQSKEAADRTQVDVSSPQRAPAGQRQAIIGTRDGAG